VAFCEIEKFPQQVLRKHWPNVPIYEDVRNVTAEKLRADGIGRIDVVTGGFPCQDLSVAGNQKGIEADRSGLWSELCRIIGDVRPAYAIVENVTALISGDNGRWFGKVLGDLAEIGYDCEWHCIPASELGANHHRDRVWIICYPSELQRDECSDNREHSKCKISESGNTNSQKNSANANSNGLQGINQRPRKDCRKAEASKRSEVRGGVASGTPTNTKCRLKSLGREIGRVRREKQISRDGYWEITSEPIIRRGDDGFSGRMVRLKGLGNAVVPQIPEIIGRAILEIERNQI